MREREFVNYIDVREPSRPMRFYVPRCWRNFSREKVGEDTGLSDRRGARINEGDLLVSRYNEYYGNVVRVVTWDPFKGAWISSADFQGGSGVRSLNGEDFDSMIRIGSIITQPWLYVPAEKLADKRERHRRKRQAERYGDR